MKVLKKVLVTILIIAVAASVLSVSAFASTYTNCADDLNSLGLFLGTDSGYALDSVHTRVEAGVMLIRLLGKEDAALTGSYTHPFTDVPSWANKYVGYLYGTGLTKGISATQFGTSGACDATMYVTFVLRALGYDDSKGDFMYSQAVDFGAIIGVVDYYLAEETFLRDEMVAISLLALSTQPKDKSVPTLLDKLVNEGAVSAAAAKPILERFAIYDAFIDATDNYNLSDKMDVDSSTTYNITAFGETLLSTATENYKMIWENNEMQMAITSKTDTQGESQTISIYYSGGYLYLNTGSDMVRMAYDPYDAMYYMQNAFAFYEPLYGLESITKTASGGNTVYKLTLTDEYLATYSSVLPEDLVDPLDPGGDVRSTSVQSITLETTLDSAGRFVGQKFHVNMTIPVSSGGIKTNAACVYTITTAVRSTSSVSISFPGDLDTYLPVSSFSY